MRISDWSSDVCSSDLLERGQLAPVHCKLPFAVAQQAEREARFVLNGPTAVERAAQVGGLCANARKRRGENRAQIDRIPERGGLNRRTRPWTTRPRFSGRRQLQPRMPTN